MSSPDRSNATVGRRAFLQAVVALPLTATIPDRQPRASDCSILLLGDLHFDRPTHHDMSWLRREKPDDVRQVENYTRLTRDVWPQTLARLKDRVAADEASAARPVAMIAQVGDLIEGLCGSPRLAERQAEEAIDSIHDAALGAPFVFCKGNHDITGPGAREAFDRLLLPFARSEADRGGGRMSCFDADGSNLATRCGQDWFLFLDAYDHPRALAWLERVLARRTARHVFLAVHPPVVPYGARSTWILYAKPGEGGDRRRLVELLGEHGVFVLSGHIHKYAAVARRTKRGAFVQMAISSVIPAPTVAASCQLEGIAAYTPEQVRVEPSFSPETESDRRNVLAAEAPHIRAFEYGDVPGYARLAVGAGVRVELYAGLATEPWRTLDLVSMRDMARASGERRTGQ